MHMFGFSHKCKIWSNNISPQEQRSSFDTRPLPVVYTKKVFQIFCNISKQGHRAFKL